MLNAHDPSHGSSVPPRRLRDQLERPRSRLPLIMIAVLGFAASALGVTLMRTGRDTAPAPTSAAPVVAPHATTTIAAAKVPAAPAPTVTPESTTATAPEGSATSREEVTNANALPTQKAPNRPRPVASRPAPRPKASKPGTKPENPADLELPVFPIPGADPHAPKAAPAPAPAPAPATESLPPL